MKNNTGLVAYAKAQLGLPYWYGTFGNIATEALYVAKKKQYPQYYNWKGTAYDNFASQYGKRVHDCVGLIKGYLWSDSATAKPAYANGSPDLSANDMRAACKDKGNIGTMPDIPGVLVFMDGHVGVYIGNGEVIEARGHEYGVVKTALKSRPWKWWGKCPWIDYGSADDTKTDNVAVKGDSAGKVVTIKCKKVRLKPGAWNVRKLPSAESSIITTVNGGGDINVSDGWLYIPSLGGFVSEKSIQA